MGLYISDKIIAISTATKTFHFDLPKDDDNNWRHKMESIKNHHNFLAKHPIKKRD